MQPQNIPPVIVDKTGEARCEVCRRIIKPGALLMMRPNPFRLYCCRTCYLAGAPAKPPAGTLTDERCGTCRRVLENDSMLWLDPKAGRAYCCQACADASNVSS